MVQNIQFLFQSKCTELDIFPNGLRDFDQSPRFKDDHKATCMPENKIANLSSLQYLTINFSDNLEEYKPQELESIGEPNITHQIIYQDGRIEDLKGE